MRTLFRRKLSFYLLLNSLQSLSALPIVMHETYDEWMENKCCPNVNASLFNDNARSSNGVQTVWNQNPSLLTPWLWRKTYFSTPLSTQKSTQWGSNGIFPGLCILKVDLFYRSFVSVPQRTVHMGIIIAMGEKCCFGSAFLKFSGSSSLSYPPTQYPLNVYDSGHLHEIGSSSCFGLQEKEPGIDGLCCFDPFKF